MRLSLVTNRADPQLINCGRQILNPVSPILVGQYTHGNLVACILSLDKRSFEGSALWAFHGPRDRRRGGDRNKGRGENHKTQELTGRPHDSSSDTSVSVTCR